MKRKKSNQKQLTLAALIDYNQEVLFSTLEKSFITKQVFNNFKNKSLTNQNKMLKKIRTNSSIRDILVDVTTNGPMLTLWPNLLSL